MTTRPKGSSINLADINGIVSVADLGAQNTDITNALVAALAAGKAIFIPIGTWLIRGITLPTGAMMFGAGRNSILKLKDASNANMLVAGIDNILYDFQLDGNKANQSLVTISGLVTSFANGLKLDNVTIANVLGRGVYSNSSASMNNIFNNLSVSGYGETGIKIQSGSNMIFNYPYIHDSDVGATGDAISMISVGAVINNITITNPRIASVANRAISCIGASSPNVSDIAITAPRITAAASHGIFCSLVDSIIINGGTISGCQIDGIHFEGNTQNCRVLNTIVRTNIAYGIQEMINGATPNNNYFLYCQATGNGNNAITKVGSNSLVL